MGAKFNDNRPGMGASVFLKSVEEKDLIIAGFGEVKDMAFETVAAEARQLNGEMNVAELIQKCIGENARVAQNQGEEDI